MNISLIISLIILLAACQSLPVKKVVPLAPSTPSQIISFSDPSLLKETLYSQLEVWKSVRYKYGGLSKKGIDCSGFVYLTYMVEFGIRLPRTTKLQATSGLSVARKELKAGDLVFFNTGLFTKHVGIYIEKGNFIHISTRRGVTISSLNNNYWSENYWKAIRIKT